MKKILFCILFIPIALLILLFGFLAEITDWMDDCFYKICDKYERWTFNIENFKD